MKPLNELFDVTYGNKLDLNKLNELPLSQGGVNFVGRSSQNHGVSGSVEPIASVAPYEAGLITVALGGSKLLSAFVQEAPFYTAQNVAVLRPIEKMTFQQKLYICLAIRHNRFRYSAFGREANRTLRTLQIPEPAEFPAWVDSIERLSVESMTNPIIAAHPPSLKPEEWRPFEYQELFDIDRGTGPRRKELDGSGETPFVTSSDSNNGITGYTSMPPTHKGNTIGVNRNGSVGEAFYHQLPFCSTEDVHIFTPKFELNPYIALFLTTLIRREKYRFGYGRKWGIERMKKSIINLPVTQEGAPDWAFMERYIKSLPYSSQIEAKPEHKASRPEGELQRLSLELPARRYMIVNSPLYLLIADQACNLCGQSNPVAAIATVNLDIPEEPQFKEFNKGEGFLLSHVDSLPESLMAAVLGLHPNYQMEFSAAAGREYFMTICQSCGGHYGDHYVHRQIRDQAFRSPKTLRVERLPFEGTFQSDAGISSSSSIADLLQSVEEGFMPPSSSDPIVEEGAAAYARFGGVINKNPYPVYSDEFNRFETGWSRALKSGSPTQRSNDDEGKTYRLDMSKFGKSG